MAGDSIDLDISDDESYSTVPIWDLSDEEDVESEDDLFWEREFADELEGLPVDKEVGTFDPEGDLAYLEALLVGSPMTDIKQEEVVVEEEEHHSWPVVLITNASKSSKPRDKAMRRTPGIMFQRLLPALFIREALASRLKLRLKLLEPKRFGALRAFLNQAERCYATVSKSRSHVFSSISVRVCFDHR
ncbi:hypothetical protein HanIR_Chr14g0676891 [Helianthus annuus]|nr:hypothetical protein HanIR_Chr14g0676891 [Helianthus annuus]